MESTRILIVEDDMIIASDISMVLSQSGYSVTGIVARGEDAVNIVRENSPDIVLMDVQLKGEIDGIEATRRITDLKKEVIVIYLTANADDATYNQAKLTRPHAFISKPFKGNELQRAIELALLRKQEADSMIKKDGTPALQETGEIANGFILRDRIFIKSRDRLIKVFLRNILFAEADRNYCRIFTEEKAHLMTLPLKAFEEKLSSDDFVRVHRSYVINLTKVDALSDNCNYVSIGQKTIPVSKSYKDGLVTRLKMM